jgi:ApaG protein
MPEHDTAGIGRCVISACRTPGGRRGRLRLEQILATCSASRKSSLVHPTVAEPTSSAETDGIRVRVQSHYLAEQSSPRDDRYVFAYTITISNESARTAQLRTRHWIITDGRGTIEEVRGDGVVGEQPRLMPGQSFQYTSGCVLTTPIGTMHGTYRMWRDDGSYFDAVIAPFSLALPASQRPGSYEAN